ncbi:Capsular polysaccharide biosynthesis glycosyltransferase CapM [Alteripontixanthobacter maritimus]|uniref:Capsular polysaccharide biosynthesis glycosyltransferase CapM n=1 Tax=Alteripontixanthobacter maritimus TaxID=2161824 RepID=A0A369Q910_9SPHN|nr:glycosyltransferase [Alteripontixanthobacter maritimus]RDC61383.1 Capsular polysaccharide biosynthesis glycosyltransferase CapM [Alteripontixanthobacter maritimus]
MPRKSYAQDRPKLALVVTDIYAFNVLSRGQLEFFRDSGVTLDLYCNGTEEGFAKLRARKVGRVIRIPFRRKPHPIMDLAALCVLFWHMLTNRYEAVVSSTPKAMLLGSIAAAFAFQRKRFCFVRGRAYETMTGAMRKAYELMDRGSFLFAHRVIFLSHSLREAYTKDGIGALEKGCVLGEGSSNGVDLVKYRVLSDVERLKLRHARKIDEDEFVIVIAGRIVPDKGVREALDLIDRLGDEQQLRWFFLGWPESNDLVAQIYKRSHLNVTHLDHTDRLQDWLGLADLSFLPSYREGFGNVGIEAAACGLPTLAFDVVGLRDSVADGVSGHLVPFGDLEASERFIRDALDDRAALADQYSGARAWVSEHFENRAVWQNYARAYLGEEWAGWALPKLDNAQI